MVSLSTSRTYAKYERRFGAFRTTVLDPTQRAAAFLRTLTPAQQRVARNALRLSLDGAIDWSRVPVARHTRNEAALRASVLARTERRALETAPLDVRERALLYACYTLRRVEVARLDWADLDLRQGLVRVPRGKGDASGWTVLPRPASRALRAWWGVQRRPPTGPVFPGQRTRPRRVTPHQAQPRDDTVGHWVRQALKRAGLWRRGRGAHAFRRTFATEWLRRNPGELRRLQVLMRHRSISTTVLYDFPDPQDFEAGVRRLRL